MPEVVSMLLLQCFPWKVFLEGYCPQDLRTVRLGGKEWACRLRGARRRRVVPIDRRASDGRHDRSLGCVPDVLAWGIGRPAARYWTMVACTDGLQFLTLEVEPLCRF